MRKLILISALLLASVSAQAGETRSLSLAGIPTVTTTVAATGASAIEAPQPIAEVSVRLAQAATTASDAAPAQVQAPAAAPVQAQTPAVTQTTTAPATTTTTATTTKPAKSVKKVRRESDEAKARRIAAKYGVYW
ncbi:MAG TPA: hypothetical protein VE567_06470 [Sphingomonas sp.]|nr:hypothetical protein [Sphingomonas sp.]